MSTKNQKKISPSDSTKVPVVTSLSLFSGIGGFEVGMMELGFEFKRHLEWDRECCETLRRNRLDQGGSEAIEPLDIWKVDPATFYSGQIDYIVGGPPCQSFSAAGRRAGGVLGTLDVRGTLFWRYCEYVQHFQPKAFVFENVRGILSSNRGEDFRIILESFREVGYNLHWRVLNSADYGVPQFRERLYLVGIRSDLNVEFRFPRPTFGPDSTNKTPYRTAEDAIGFLDDGVVAGPYGGKYGNLIPEIPEGENYRVFTEEMGHPTPLFAWRSKFSGFLYKMAKDAPCRTIVSQQSRYDGPLHWQNRKCTQDELKLLQGFPLDFQLPSSYAATVKQIGNSVTPPVANYIARALRFQIESLDDYKVELLEPEVQLTFDRKKHDRARRSQAAKVASYRIGQPMLFDEVKIDSRTIKWSEQTSKLKITGVLRSGHAIIKVDGNDSTNHEDVVILEFVGSVRKKIRQIRIETRGIRSTAEALQACWLEVHHIVNKETSYESLQPLWGHFTEPYPKFSIEFQSTRNDMPARFQRHAFELALSKETCDFATFTKMLGVKDPDGALRRLKSIGFDLRTNSDSAAINPGLIKVCYPYIKNLPLSA